jgi:hypothetical protein
MNARAYPWRTAFLRAVFEPEVAKKPAQIGEATKAIEARLVEFAQPDGVERRAIEHAQRVLATLRAEVSVLADAKDAPCLEGKPLHGVNFQSPDCIGNRRHHRNWNNRYDRSRQNYIHESEHGHGVPHRRFWGLAASFEVTLGCFAEHVLTPGGATPPLQRSLRAFRRRGRYLDLQLLRA